MIRRLLACFALAGALLAPAPLHAQDANAASPANPEDTGSPIYGYLGFAALAGIFLVVVCKSARRS